MAPVIVAATSSGASPNPFSRSPLTGRSVAPAMAARVVQRLVAGDVAVETSEAAREAAARRGQGPEAEVGEEPGGADVPRVRHDERLRPVVELTEAVGLIGTGGHAPSLGTAGGGFLAGQAGIDPLEHVGERRTDDTGVGLPRIGAALDHLVDAAHASQQQL